MIYVFCFLVVIFIYHDFIFVASSISGTANRKVRAQSYGSYAQQESVKDKEATGERSGDTDLTVFSQSRPPNRRSHKKTFKIENKVNVDKTCFEKAISCM